MSASAGRVVMLLLAMAAFVGCNDRGKAESENSKPAFTLMPRVAVELESADGHRLFKHGRFRLEERLGETEDSPGGGVVASAALAEVQELSRDLRSIRLRLTVRTVASRRAEAESVARADISLDIPPGLENDAVFLRIGSEGENGLGIRVVDPAGEAVAPLPGAGGLYLLEPKPGENYRISSWLKSQIDSRETGTSQDSGSAILAAMIEPGPILFSKLVQPYIVGGIETDLYDQVGAIRINNITHCTGTVIAPKTVLTAAHCVAGYETHIAQRRFTFSIGPSALSPRQVIPVASGDYPKGGDGGFKYDPVNHTDDLGILYLADAPAVTAGVPHANTPVWADIQQSPLTFVGYGYNKVAGGSQGLGIKRTAEWRVQVEAKTVSWANPNTSTCKHDSGGPALRAQGGSLLILAVNSKAGASCTRGVNTRVDVYRAWLQPRMR